MKQILLQTEEMRTQKKPPLQIEVADSFFTRFLGLMGRKKLPAGHGLLLAPCSSIHMSFMRFAIDAVYIDKDYRILKIVHHLRPWLGFSWCQGAWGVIELNAGAADFSRLQTGEQFHVN